ncbi:MAG TPA: hypothetical protein VIQ31_01585 [Phormidium sp.]
MIPPAKIEEKWSLLALTALLPLTLVGVGLQEQTAQARQPLTENKAVASSNGVYLYGNSPQPDQIAHSYVVFERQNGKVIGAFYSPQSEFTCFTGEVEGTRLEVEALVPEESETQAVRTQLADLHPLQTVSANDHRMLAVCQNVTSNLAAQQ